MDLTDLSDKEVQDFQEKGELMVAGHLLSGTDLKVKKYFTVIKMNRCHSLVNFFYLLLFIETFLKCLQSVCVTLHFVR